MWKCVNLITVNSVTVAFRMSASMSLRSPTYQVPARICKYDGIFIYCARNFVREIFSTLYVKLHPSIDKCAKGRVSRLESLKQKGNKFFDIWFYNPIMLLVEQKIGWNSWFMQWNKFPISQRKKNIRNPDTQEPTVREIINSSRFREISQLSLTFLLVSLIIQLRQMSTQCTFIAKLQC